MARAPTTHDPYNAIAEPKRRRVLELLIEGERPVNDLVQMLDLPQPVVSKHLGVLREVGLVSVRKHGRQRLYRLEADQLKPLHDWIGNFKEIWEDRFDRLDEYLHKLQQKEELSDD